ncbi:MAG: hypothetical protein AB1564_09800 [Chloroflexota bacterium]
MTEIISWIAAILCTAYGALTAFAGIGQLKVRSIQTWAAWGMVLFGLVVFASAVLILLGSEYALWILLVGLIGIHVIAINNGYKMFGKINPVHHAARLFVSLFLIILTIVSMK